MDDEYYEFYGRIRKLQAELEGLPMNRIVEVSVLLDVENNGHLTDEQLYDAAALLVRTKLTGNPLRDKVTEVDGVTILSVEAAERLWE